VLFAEIDEFLGRGVAISPENLRVSYKTHLVMPYHMQEDACSRSRKRKRSIGTTQARNRPAYAKMHRTTALRVADLLHEAKLKEKLEYVVTDRNKVFKALYDMPPIDWREIFETYRDFGRRIQPYVDDVGYLILEANKQGKRILWEGAHATLLDVDHGTYPYVTSSNCSSLGLFTGSGTPPQIVHELSGHHESLQHARGWRAVSDGTGQ
jgi:adenylosuccinate synthase